jgi:hypothetical protein
MFRRAVSQKTINARKGITTVSAPEVGSWAILSALAQKTINARKGITTGDACLHPARSVASENNKCPQGHYDQPSGDSQFGTGVAPSENNKCPQGHYDSSNHFPVEIDLRQLRKQ